MTARVQNGEDAEALLQPVMEKIKEQVGGYLYGIDVGDLQTAAVHALKASGLHVAVAGKLHRRLCGQAPDRCQRRLRGV